MKTNKFPDVDMLGELYANGTLPQLEFLKPHENKKPLEDKPLLLSVPSFLLGILLGILSVLLIHIF